MSKVQFEIAQRVFLSNYMPINGYDKSLVDCVQYKMTYSIKMGTKIGENLLPFEKN